MNNSIWTVDEVTNIVDESSINIIKLSNVEEKDLLTDLSDDDVINEILEYIKYSPLIINDHGGVYDLRDGHMLYIMDNGMIGFGVRGQVHSINRVGIFDGLGKVYVSRMSIAGVVRTSDRHIKSVRDQLEILNNNEYASCRVKTIVYFVD